MVCCAGFLGRRSETDARINPPGYTLVNQSPNLPTDAGDELSASGSTAGVRRQAAPETGDAREVQTLLLNDEKQPA